MTIASLSSAFASWTAPHWTTYIGTAEDAVIYSHLVGTVPSPGTQPLPVLLIQRDELTTDGDSCHVKRDPAAILVHGTVRVLLSDVAHFIEILQKTLKCLA